MDKNILSNWDGETISPCNKVVGNSIKELGTTRIREVTHDEASQEIWLKIIQARIYIYKVKVTPS